MSAVPPKVGTDHGPGIRGTDFPYHDTVILCHCADSLADMQLAKHAFPAEHTNIRVGPEICYVYVLIGS